jgi:hypothetical protein
MTHIIVDTNGTARAAICGEKMPVSEPTDHEFYYRFGEADLRARELPEGLDCQTCSAVAAKVKRGWVLSAAIREVYRERRRIA